MKNLSQSKLIASSAKNPCPICDHIKDGDCSFNDDVVLCHGSIDTDAQKDGFIYRGATDCGLWGQYFPAVEPIPKTTKEFFYPSPDGSPLVRVTRKDDGDGKLFFVYQSPIETVYGVYLRRLVQEIPVGLKRRQLMMPRFRLGHCT